MKIFKQHSCCVLHVGNKKFVLASVLRKTLYFLIWNFTFRTYIPKELSQWKFQKNTKVYQSQNALSALKSTIKKAALKRRPGFILQQEDLSWITVKSSDVHQQLNQSKSTTFFHFFLFPLCFFGKFSFFGLHWKHPISHAAHYELWQLYLKFQEMTTKEEKLLLFFAECCKYCNLRAKKTIIFDFRGRFPLLQRRNFQSLLAGKASILRFSHSRRDFLCPPVLRQKKRSL